jgi:hypothetical protein
MDAQAITQPKHPGQRAPARAVVQKRRGLPIQPDTKRRNKLKSMCELDRFENDLLHRLDRPTNREKRRYKAGRNCPTSAWADAVWFGENHVNDVTGEAWRTRVEFPPGMDQTNMIRCCECGRYTPPNNVVMGLICEDCAADRNCVCTQDDALVEGVARQSIVYQQFRQVGLTDREIAVLSVWHEGHSIRQVAEFFGRTSRAIQQTVTAAKAKITKSGLSLPPRKHEPRAGRPRIVDPQKLQAMIDSRS